jgi:serine/threonine protein phosphatase 1
MPDRPFPSLPADGKPIHYFIGDIHGHCDKLVSLIETVEALMGDDDALVFLGDYIDRGESSYEVIEYLIHLSRKHKTVFLKGNHEDMMLRYLQGEDLRDMYLVNGGERTIESYRRHCGAFRLPGRHRDFFRQICNFITRR